MWLGWPFLVYEEWLKMFRPPSPEIVPPSGERFGMTESAKELVVVAEAPEFRRTELDATIHENILNIRGERYEEDEGSELHVSYDRKVPLPGSVNPEEAITSLRDGLVEVHIPKWPGVADVEPSPSKIPVPQEMADEMSKSLADLPIPGAARPEGTKPSGGKASRGPRAPALARRKAAKKRGGTKKGLAKRGKGR